MIKINKTDPISKMIESKTENTWSGLPWDDGPENYVTRESFKHNGVFLEEKDISLLIGWLRDYAEMLYFNGKKNRLNRKYEIKEAREVSVFIDQLNS